MIKVQFITVGKLKEKYWRDAAGEYMKRLGAFCKPEIVELSEARLSESPSPKEIAAALEQEACAMDKYLDDPRAYTIALCIEGGQLTSEELSARLTGLGTQGYSAVKLIIGSSYGIAERIKKRCDLRLSMSKLTFPHQLARIMLLEQVYRAFMIGAGAKYHK